MTPYRRQANNEDAKHSNMDTGRQGPKRALDVPQGTGNSLQKKQLTFWEPKSLRAEPRLCYHVPTFSTSRHDVVIQVEGRAGDDADRGRSVQCAEHGEWTDHDGSQSLKLNMC